MSAKLLSSPIKNPYSKFAPKFIARRERSVEKPIDHEHVETLQDEVSTDLHEVNEEPVESPQEGRDSFNILVEAAQEAQKMGNKDDEGANLQNNQNSIISKPSVESSLQSNEDESHLASFQSSESSGQVKNETPMDENIPLSQLSSIPINFEDEDASQSKRMTKASIRRKKRKLIVDNVGTEQESININETKMSALCDDPGIGRKSQRFVEIEKILLEEKLAKRKKRTGSVTPAKEESPQRDMQSVNNISSQTNIQEPEEEEEVVGTVETEPEGQEEVDVPESNMASKSILDQLADKMDSDGQFNHSTASAPRTRVVDGQIVLDEASLEVDRHERDYVPEEDREFVEENALSRRVTSATWGNRQKSEKWKTDETDKFYKALSQWGTDFALISNMFPSRNRRQIKLKFKQEEKRNPARINEALRTKKPVDMEEYSKESGKVFRPVEEVEKELAHIRSAFEEERKRAVETAEQRQVIANYEAEQERNAPQPKQEREIVFEDGIEVVGQVA